MFAQLNELVAIHITTKKGGGKLLSLLWQQGEMTFFYILLPKKYTKCELEEEKLFILNL